MLVRKSHWQRMVDPRFPMTQNQEPSATANYTESWKSTIEQYLEAFMAFFFPQSH